MPKPLPPNIETGPGQGAGRPGPPGPPGAGFSAGLDLTGTSSEQSVIGFRTRPLSTNVPSPGDAYVFNGSEWVPQPAGGGGTVPPLSSFLFVDAGSAALSPDGSVGKPFPRIQQALDVANAARGTWGIFISPGNYDETMNVGAGVNVSLYSPAYGLVNVNLSSYPGLTWTISSECSITLRNIAMNSISATDGPNSAPNFGLLYLDNSSLLSVSASTYELDMTMTGPNSYVRNAHITGAFSADGSDYVKDTTAASVQIQSSFIRGTISASSGNMILTACQFDTATTVALAGYIQSVYMDSSTYYWLQEMQTNLTGSPTINLMDTGTTLQVKAYNADLSGYTYNVVPRDAGMCLSLGAASSAITAVIPKNMPANCVIYFYQSNLRQITLTGASGVSVFSGYGNSNGLTSYTAGSLLRAYQVSTNSWVVTGDSVALHTPAPVAPTDHDTTFSPVGLWQLHESLADTSGNGIGLTANSQTHYADLYPIYFGWDGIDGNGFHTTTVPSPSALRITGDMTIEALVKMPANVRGSAGAGRYIIAFDSNNGLSTGNRLYGVGVDSSGYPQWSQQSGTNVDSNYVLSNYFFPEGLFHLAVTRNGNVIQFYVNGRPLGSASGVLTTPTGGSLSNFQFGSQGGAPLAVALASVKVIASALTAAQVKAEYNRTLGKVFGAA